jgi:hypothetical protein
MVQPVDTFTEKAAAEPKLAYTNVLAIHLLYWIVSQGYILNFPGVQELRDFYDTTTSPCTIIAHTIHSYLQFHCKRYDKGDNDTTQVQPITTVYCPWFYLYFPPSHKVSRSAQKRSITIILPSFHRRRHPSILLLFQLIECIFFFIAMQ